MPSSNVGTPAHAARWTIGLAAGALLLGHGLTYAVVQPDAHARAGLLASTGHAYIHLLEGPALALALGSVLAAAALGLRRIDPAPRRASLFRRLATIQIAAFATMEIAERIASGSIGRARLADAAVVGLGIVVQIVLALIGAWFLDAVRRGGRRLVETLGTADAGLRRLTLVVAPVGARPVTSLAAIALPPGRGPPRRRR
jgi:hypothetical protein